MKGLTRLALIAVAAVGMGLVASAPSWAIHKGAGGLVCGGCHTMHNSQGNLNLVDGASASGGSNGGSLILLRAGVSSRAEIHNLCLQCHAAGGSRDTDTHEPHGQLAPKVLLSTATNWNQDLPFSKIGAGGDFAPGCGVGFTSGVCTDNAVTLGKAHSLGETGVIPPGGQADGALDYLTCTNCHDPHGVSQASTPGSDNTSSVANDYRMLRKYPTGSAGGTTTESGGSLGNTSTKATSSYYGGITGESVGAADVNYVPATSPSGDAIWPITTGDNPTTATGNNKYGVEVAAWCAACHDNWHETNDSGNDGSTTTTGASGAAGDWRRHPVANVIDEGNCVPGGTAEAGCSGADVDIIRLDNYDANTTTPTALPVAGLGTWYIADTTTQAGTARVFCLSCHFPHGSPYNDLLRWDYTSAVGAGAQAGYGQDGNVVPSNRGCQLCHNRGGF